MDYEYEESANRQRALQGYAILERTSQSLARSEQAALETERIGTEVLSELESQRESLLRTRQRLEDADEELSQARRVLNSMYKNIIANKIILCLIIILEMAILGGSLYHKLS
ncbi:vesicle transport through interaction with t-SNAREs homolog 1B [Neocloeon triangulifer]|uniref:vesicle transport through interaction with t-SNAREs homolog 1B n=1 Tax=Neocloeon triangulifer TaxID=2078957 RepID=UPI00286ECAA6|nr:vesicle transport through interaction with t-SNAREs homolog 1B [Neocloeon triangulifer]XP_059490485.1 vesicle transport through interaction with t-SNAREs homolog 1B [Neocloeon triangulifer]